MNEICAGQDIIDSRDVISRIEEIEGDIEGLKEDITNAENKQEAEDELESYLTDNEEELESLKKLNDECESNRDWTYGVTLIHEDYFTEYCEDLLNDLGYVSKEAWFVVIDWEATAQILKQDYTRIEFDNETYFIRSI